MPAAVRIFKRRRPTIATPAPVPSTPTPKTAPAESAGLAIPLTHVRTHEFPQYTNVGGLESTCFPIAGASRRRGLPTHFRR